jgi:hypothetical protein
MLRQGAAGAVTERRVTAPLDGHVLDGVLGAEECGRLVGLTERLGFSFWHPSRRDDPCYDTIACDTMSDDRAWLDVAHRLFQTR